MLAILTLKRKVFPLKYQKIGIFDTVLHWNTNFDLKYQKINIKNQHFALETKNFSFKSPKCEL